MRHIDWIKMLKDGPHTQTGPVFKRKSFLMHMQLRWNRDRLQTQNIFTDRQISSSLRFGDQSAMDEPQPVAYSSIKMHKLILRLFIYYTKSSSYRQLTKRINKKTKWYKKQHVNKCLLPKKAVYGSISLSIYCVCFFIRVFFCLQF